MFRCRLLVQVPFRLPDAIVYQVNLWDRMQFVGLTNESDLVAVFIKDITRAIHLIRELAPPSVVALRTTPQKPTEQPAPRGMLYNAALRSVAHDLGLPLFDWELMLLSRAAAEAFRDIMHPSVQYSESFARLLMSVFNVCT